ncbi:MAG: GTP pyrophosphokinase [Deltaproteobacteria bacterium]|nr:MAG: GTP pyrophosphokinase [Deltaproteobacteria bacterium]
MIRINDILDRILEYNPDADLDVIDRAYIFTARCHEGQVRLSGEPYLSHPLAVAYILADMCLDVESVAAGLLHDVIEDTPTTEADIRDMFGPGIAHIVSGVTKLEKIAVANSEIRQAESMRKMILAMADDLRVILVKLADRVHNMRTLKYHKSPEKQAKIAQETLDIYASIAARLGIYWIKHELEDISFRYTQPDDYALIKMLVKKDQHEREAYVEAVKELLKTSMADAKIQATVSGRSKQYFSIFNKMMNQNLDFEDVYDLTAFRIIVNTIPQCYEVLGKVHAMWKPIPKKFKDYIGMPKANMYQSLHTTVIGPSGERIEIQIRTHEMDKVAKSGIAAHWSYKEGKAIDSKTGETFSWIQNLIENQANIRDPKEFMENVRIDLFPDEIYVFTPKGEIKTLPKGATPVDFAYAIHTEVGDQCTGAKLNRRMTPLSTELRNGDLVEISTTNGHKPSKDWLAFVKTVKARSRIRHWIRSQEKGYSIHLGKELCEKTFRKHKLNFNTLIKQTDTKTLAESFGYKTFDDILANVGYGKITPLHLLHKLAPQTKALDSAADSGSVLNKLIGRNRKKRPGGGIIVKGLDDILVRFGKCCQPVPGDAITGYITMGHGVTIHRTTCVHAMQMNPERQIDVEWDTDTNETYPVRICIDVQDNVGALAAVTAEISSQKANITDVSIDTSQKKMAHLFFTLTVENKDHLKQIMTSITRLKYVRTVKRMDG